MSRQSVEVKNKHCSVCGEPATDIICEACKAKIHGEGAHKKQSIEKEVKKGTGRK
jgi:hypothetical protein